MKCESDGYGNCKYCGADEPPPWPTTEKQAQGGEARDPDAHRDDVLDDDLDLDDDSRVELGDPT